MSENNDSNSDDQSGESLSEPEIVSGPTGESGELQEIKEWKDKYLRLLADFDNNRKRVARDLDESRKFANESLLRSFLPVLDNLERALKHVETGDSGVSAECQSLVEGVRLTHKQFVELLEKNHVTKVLSEGVPFDPEVHEAVGYTESGTYPEGTIVDVYQQGYRIQNRLIRPAMVTVSKGNHS